MGKEGPMLGAEPIKVFGRVVGLGQREGWLGREKGDRFSSKFVTWRNHRVHILVEMKQGECVCPLSRSVHCNFVLYSLVIG